MTPSASTTFRDVAIYRGDVGALYAEWPKPIAIVSDGGYGIGGFPGDPRTPEGLPEWYAPHVEAWAKHASPRTTLWFWCTEVGWATVHPHLVASGWQYVALNIWDKGIAHVAGNVNSKTIRRFPTVTEVCAHYVRPPIVTGESSTLQRWFREEWRRTGLPLSAANTACGVKAAAARKYLSADVQWYFPPPETFRALSDYANAHGNPAGRPYFPRDAVHALTREGWSQTRATFRLREMGVTNVWREPAVRGAERLKEGGCVVHTNQKPLVLCERVVSASTDSGDVVWEPFGGLCTVALACLRRGRRCVSAEVQPRVYAHATQRLRASVLDAVTPSDLDDATASSA